MQTYRRFVSYVYQYENGKKAGNRGFIKVEARGNTCSMQIALKGVCRDASGSCKVFGFKREDGLLKGSLLAECPVRTGVVQEQLAFLRSSMGNAGYSLHELSGVIFQGDDQTMYGTQWDDEPMKMENFQPDDSHVLRQSPEESAQEEAKGQAEPPAQDAPWETPQNMMAKEEEPRTMAEMPTGEEGLRQSEEPSMEKERGGAQEPVEEREACPSTESSRERNWAEPIAGEWKPVEPENRPAEKDWSAMQEPASEQEWRQQEEHPMETKWPAAKSAAEEQESHLSEERPQEKEQPPAEQLSLEAETPEAKAMPAMEAAGASEVAAVEAEQPAPAASLAEEPGQASDAPEAQTETFAEEKIEIVDARPAVPQPSKNGAESIQEENPAEQAIQPEAAFTPEHLGEKEPAAAIIQPEPAPMPKSMPEESAPEKAAHKEAQIKESAPGQNQKTQEKKEQMPAPEIRGQNPPEPNRAFASAAPSPNAQAENPVALEKEGPQEEGLPEVLDTTVDLAAFNMEAAQIKEQEEGGQEDYIKQDMKVENVAEEVAQEAIAPKEAMREIAAQEAIAPKEAVQETADLEEIAQEKVYAQEEKASGKRNFCPFTDGVLENCQKITLDDIFKLDPRDHCLRNNRFVQHGYQMFGHLLLAKVARNCQYILGVPGIYQQQEKFMADMHGFHSFKCARRRNSKTPCFGYWYRLIYPPKSCAGNGRAR